MGIQERKERHQENLRIQILEAAEELFENKAGIMMTTGAASAIRS